MLTSIISITYTVPSRLDVGSSCNSSGAMASWSGWMSSSSSSLKFTLRITRYCFITMYLDESSEHSPFGFSIQKSRNLVTGVVKYGEINNLATTLPIVIITVDINKMVHIIFIPEEYTVFVNNYNYNKQSSYPLS